MDARPDVVKRSARCGSRQRHQTVTFQQLSHVAEKGLIPGKRFVAPIVEHVNMVLTIIKYNRQEHARGVSANKSHVRTGKERENEPPCCWRT